MKQLSKILLASLLAFVMNAGLEGAEKSLKVLTIGNSFASSVVGELNRIVKSDPECKLVIKRANLGGCTLERHWREHLKGEKDPNYKPYRNGKNKNTLVELLKSDKWDIVTIQQASTGSFKPETYEPYAGNLIGLVRKYAPSAEIVIQQTWSYNQSNFQFKRWKIDQKTMYERARDAYEKMAKRYNCRVIPTGLAVQIHREKLGKNLISMPTTGKYEYPKVPVTNDLSGYGIWRKDKKTGERVLVRDMSHLNADGRYMQGCLWFSFLYGKDPLKIKYAPAGMKKEQAVHLRQCASEALAKYKQVKK